MKQHQKFVTALAMMLVLGGLSPVMAADATARAVAEPERQSDGHSATATAEQVQPRHGQFESRASLTLTPEQMDKIHGGECTCSSVETSLHIALYNWMLISAAQMQGANGLSHY